MNRALAIVNQLLEAVPPSDLKDMAMGGAADDAENFLELMLSIGNSDEFEEEEGYFTEDPPLKFAKYMLDMDMTPAEAMRHWLTWEDFVDEKGEWVLDLAYEEGHLDDVDDLKRWWDEHYYGEAKDAEEWARERVASFGDLPEHYENYFNWEKYGEALLQDMRTFEDPDSGKTYIFDQ